MRWLSIIAIPALICFAGCAKPKPADRPVEFGAVPGPSQTQVTLSPTSDSAAPGSATTNSSPKPVEQRKSAKKSKPPIITADVALRGKVSRYNADGRFVVLEFPIAHLPRVGQSMFVYRNGLKVGEVKVTGPQRDDRTVADVTTGEAQAGDDVRGQ